MVMKANLRWQGLIVAISIMALCGCSKDPIETVKSGTLDFDKTVTVGNALDGYKFFNNKSWKKIETDQKREIVEFRGDINFDAYKDIQIKFMIVPSAEMPLIKESIVSASYVAQFAINQDKKGFEIKYNGFEVTGKNGDKFPSDIKDTSTLQSIYKNEPDEATLYMLYVILDSVKSREKEAKKQQEKKVNEDYRSEAKQAAIDLWKNILTQCGDSYFCKVEVGNSNIVEIKGSITANIVNWEVVQKKELSEADKLNNVKPSTVLWKGESEVAFETLRYFDKGANKWSDWGKRSFNTKILKDAEGWKFVAGEYGTPVKIDCSQMPVVQEQAANQQ